MKVNRSILTTSYDFNRASLCTYHGRDRKKYDSVFSALIADYTATSVFVSRKDAAATLKKFRQSQKTA